ncbi:bt1 folate biopterin transporter family related [Cystoisospora suis]|uniref:Bt1 folate biopterin transporter family related n=1 Tax=Cystoisospora suis TaxID=483139 RepID=A0A2C6KVF5_9APIC|nr:bt1 folate biopterin transporter family related [Cystoisospora suis]
MRGWAVAGTVVFDVRRSATSRLDPWLEMGNTSAPDASVFSRCENGLTVEKDVFVTKKELIQCLWKNGYTDTEINAFEIAFPGDYKFHYPELAVLFDLAEEDCYKFCIRLRAANPEELVELKYKKPQNLVSGWKLSVVCVTSQCDNIRASGFCLARDIRGGRVKVLHADGRCHMRRSPAMPSRHAGQLLSSYGLCFLGVWFGLSNTVLSNAWFYSKTFPFGAVFYMLASYFYREIREFFWKEEKSLAHTARENKNVGEELVYRQMKKYANDTKCLDYLMKFRDEVEEQMSQYRVALISQMRRKVIDRLVEKLNAIQQAEKVIQGSLQEVMVHEIVASFKDNYSARSQLEDEALRSAINGLAGTDTVMDPVGAHFKASLQELAKVDLASVSANPSGTVVERVAAVFQQREKEFLDSFTVKASEAQEVQNLVRKCKSASGFDFSSLQEEELKRLEQLYSSVNSRIGFEPAHEETVKSVAPLSGKSKEFVDFVNKQVEVTKAKLRTARLTAFAHAFA